MFGSKSNTTHTVMASSIEEKRDWIQGINKAISEGVKRRSFDTSLANNMKLPMNEGRAFPKFAENVCIYVDGITH